MFARRIALIGYILTLQICQGAFAVETLSVGDPFSYSIKLPVADSVSILNPTDIPVQVLPFARDIKSAQGNLEFSAAVYDTGSYSIPPIAVLLFKGGQIFDTIWTEPREIVVESVLTDTSSAPRPIKPYEEHPLRLSDVVREFWPWAVGAFLLAALAFAWLRYRMRPKAGSEPPPVPPLPPAELAIRELIALRDKKYPERGMIKEQYSEFSEVMRRYVESRYNFPALEMTTYEVASELKRDDLPVCLREELLPVLRESDLVKFAKQIPTLAQAISVVDIGFSIVERTRPGLETVKEAEKEGQTS